MKNVPLSSDRENAELNLCLEDGLVAYSRHFKEELANDGLTMEDVLTVCRSGAVIMAPEPDIRTGDWKYRMEGRTADDENVAMVFTFKLERKAVLITVFKRTHE